MTHPILPRRFRLPSASRLAIALAALAAGGGCANTSETKLAEPAAVALSASEPAARSGSTLQFLAERMAADGNHTAAIPLYRRAHRLHPGDAGPLLGLGRSLAATGANAEAADVLKAAYERDSDNPENAVALANAYLAVGRAALALPLFEAALAADPANAAAQNGKATALASAGENEGAREAYLAGLALKPEDLALRSNLGLTLSLAGEHKEAAELLEAVATDPNATARHRQTLALAYGLAGRDDDARRIAAIDLDSVATDRNVGTYAALRAMTPAARAGALLGGLSADKVDIDAPANLKAGADESAARAAIRRLVVSPDKTAILAPDAPAAAEIEPEIAPNPQQSSVSPPPPLEGQAYAVQLAAYRRNEELAKGWNELQALHADVLAGLEARRSEVDFGVRDTGPSGVYYRLDVGPLTDPNAALRLCAAIRERGGDCWVRAPAAGATQAVAASSAVPGKPQAATADAPAHPAPAQRPRVTLDVEALINPKPDIAPRTVWTDVTGSDEAGGMDSGEEIEE